MNKREQLLSIAGNGNLEQFIKFIGTCKSEGLDVTEILSGCSKKQLDKLWEGIQTTCAATMLSMEVGEDTTDDHLEGEMRKVLEVLDCVVTLATATIHQVEPHMPPCLQSTAVLLHGLLLPMPESANALKNDITTLCEDWWHKDLPGKDELITNSLIYLLQRSLALQNKREVKRVWSLHKALSNVNMSNASSDMLRDLLQQCTISAAFLKCDEGCRFLGFVLSLDENLTECLHKIIKNQLPTASRNVMETYGEIYFRAWQNATGPVLEKLESGCIQSFMYYAIHGQKSLAAGLRRFLGYIHNQKKQGGVDGMLLRLYGPLLWRSLKVANPVVRENAALLLLDVFPLQDQSLGNEELDHLLQKQFDMFQTLLADTYPSIRSVTVRKLCNILCTYCELIPAETIKNLITKMIQDLVWDAASADVRESVIVGMATLLDNQLCIPILKPILPQLSNHIHDNAEKVRVAMMELLLKVKGIRAIKFWNIVPVEHILARLEIDSPLIARRIIKLLLNTFLPLDKPGDVQLDRCVSLIESNPGAARQFFHYASTHMSLHDKATYIILLTKCILRCIKLENSRGGGGDNPAEETEETNGDDEAEDGGSEEDPTLTIHNTVAMRGLVETIVILWSVINDDLKKRANRDIEQNLQKKISLAVPEMLKVFNDPHICTALVRLAGFVPSNSIPTISRTCLSKLRHMTADNAPEDYSCFLEAMCKWGKVTDIMDLVDEWLTEGLHLEDTPAQQKSVAKVGKKRKSVGFVTPLQAQPLLAIQYVSYMLRHPVCQSLLLTNYVKELAQLRTQLHTVMNCIEVSLNHESSDKDPISDGLLAASFGLYCKLVVLLHQADSAESTMSAFEEVMSWADVQLLPMLSLVDEEDVDTTRKRTIQQSQHDRARLTLDLVKTLLAVSGNVLLIGIGDVSFAAQLADFCVVCLQKDESLSSLPDVLNCLYHVTEHMVLQDDSSHGNAIPGYLGKVFITIAMALQKGKAHVTKLLPSVRNHVMEMLSSVYRSPLMEENILRELMATVIGALMGELAHTSEKLELEETSGILSELPPLTGWLCECVCKKNYIAKYFVGELRQCVESGAVTDLHNLHGMVHLLGSITKYKSKIPGLKDCWIAVESLSDKAKQEPPSGDEREVDVLQSLTSKVQEYQQTLGLAS